MSEDERLLRETAKDLRAWAQRRSTMPARMQAEGHRRRSRADDLAFAEVMARGVDPKRPRRFRGRITLTVLCRPKGHELANVYPTGHGLVLVPCVAAAPLRPGKPTSLLNLLHRQETALWRLFHPDAPADVVPQELQRVPRDHWVEQHFDEDGEPGQAFIRGMQRLDLERLASAPDRGRYAFDLRCRCGTRYLFVPELSEALQNNERRVVV